jgi:hypothetical protein
MSRWSQSALVQEFERLEMLADPHARGVELEPLLRRLFRRAQFRAELNTAVASPRQTDLVATNGRDTYLVESVWESGPAGVDDVDQVRTRLAETHASVVGLLVSVGGFTSGAVDRVRDKRERPVLLLGGAELRDVLDSPALLAGLLRHKWDELVMHARVSVDDTPYLQRPGRSTPRERAGLPAADTFFLLADLERTSVIACQGNYDEFVFTLDMPDSGWLGARENGVSLELQLSLDDEADLIELLGELADIGWVTSSCRWNLQQAETSWHGSGAAELADTLRDWRARYESAGAIHHTEQLSYVDVAGGGFYSLTADLSASDQREVRFAEISVQLPGVPVDPTALRHLTEVVGAPDEGFLRVRDDGLREGYVLPREARREVRPLGFVVESDPFENDEAQRLWAKGIVIENPFQQESGPRATATPEELPVHIFGSDILVCSLRNWHPLAEPRTTYRIERYEWVHTADVLIFRGIANWD